jgi:hypothetical protein
LVALATIVLASYVGVASDSPAVLVTVAIAALVAVVYLLHHGRLLRSEQARWAEDRQRRREALGMPQDSRGDEGYVMPLPPSPLLVVVDGHGQVVLRAGDLGVEDDILNVDISQLVEHVSYSAQEAGHVALSLARRVRLRKVPDHPLVARHAPKGKCHSQR